MRIKNKIWPTNMPPRIEEVKIYFSQKGMNEQEAEAFIMFYEMKCWSNKRGCLFKNWKGIAHGWIMSAFRVQPWLFNKSIH